MNVTAECINNGAVDYGYFPVRTLRLQNAAELPCILYQGVPHYIDSRATMYIDIDFTDLINYDAIVFTTPPKIPFYIGAMFTGSVYPFLLVAESYQIPVFTFHAIGSKNFFYTTNKKSTNFSSTSDFSEIVNELELTKDSSVLLVHPAENTPFLDCNPIDAIQFFKEYYENH